MKKINSLCAVLLAIMLIPDVVMAQVCPATNGTTALPGNAAAGVSGAAPASFFSGVAPCATAMEGSPAPTSCIIFVVPGAIHNLGAKWASYAQRTMAPPSARCRFDCGVGQVNTCYVKNDGLPVELMEFSVDE